MVEIATKPLSHLLGTDFSFFEIIEKNLRINNRLSIICCIFVTVKNKILNKNSTPWTWQMSEHRPQRTDCRLYSCIHWLHCHLAPQALLRLRNVWRTIPGYQRRTAGTDVHRASASDNSGIAWENCESLWFHTGWPAWEGYGRWRNKARLGTHSQMWSRFQKATYGLTLFKQKERNT